ncbi:MAG: hypothetical protein IPK13_20830 [Deltaproteobacteria bacterium]|nr:hypothetical protein [Deltaproteobacteria bacterium]
MRRAGCQRSRMVSLAPAMLAVGAGLAWALTGCVDVQELGLPPARAAGGAVLLVAVAPGDNARVFAVDPVSDGASGLSLRQDDRLLALVFSDTLEAMGLSSGVQVVRGYARPVPFPFDVYEALAGSGDEPVTSDGDEDVGRGGGASERRTWRPRRVAEVQSIVDAIRLPSFGSGDCEARAGCFRVRPDEGGRLDAYCEVPCQFPEVPEAGDVEVPRAPDMRSDACPASWRLNTPSSSEDVSTCVPASRVPCPPGKVQFGDSGDCAAVDIASCPADGWPLADRLDVGGAPVVFVDRGAASGSASTPDGTKEHPHPSISAALAEAAAGSTLAVRVGEYEETLVFEQGFQLIGACAAGVVVRGGSSAGPTLRVGPGAGAHLEGISIRGEQQALALDGPAEVLLRGVDVSATSGPGIIARGDVRLSLIRTALGPSMRYGVYFENTQSESSTATPGLELEHVVVHDVAGDAISLRGAGVRAVLSDVVVERSRASGGLRGKGLEAQSGAQAQISRCLFAENVSHDVSADTNASITLLDVWIRDGRAEGEGEGEGGTSGGYGLEILRGGHIAAQRLNVQGKHYGVYVGRGGRATFEDTRIVDTQDIGIVVRDGGEIEAMKRTLVLRARRAGVDIFDAPASLENVTVARTRAVAPDDDDYCSVHEYEKGAGLRIRGASRVRGHGVAVVEVEGAGIAVGNRQPNRIGGGPILPSCNDSFVEDVSLNDVRVERSVVGVASYFGAAIFQNLELSENRVAGIDLALGRLDVSDALITGTNSSAGILLSTRFPHANDGRLGVSVLKRLRVAQHAAGIRIDDPNEAFVEEAAIEHNAIGLQIRQAGFDRHALRESIAYRHNHRVFEE